MSDTSMSRTSMSRRRVLTGGVAAAVGTGAAGWPQPTASARAASVCGVGGKAVQAVADRTTVAAGVTF